MILATFSTGSFEFAVVEVDAEHARAALERAWAIHAEQTGADPDYFGEYAGDVNYSEPMTWGVVLRDGSPVERRLAAA